MEEDEEEEETREEIAEAVEEAWREDEAERAERGRMPTCWQRKMGCLRFGCKGRRASQDYPYRDGQ